MTVTWANTFLICDADPKKVIEKLRKLYLGPNVITIVFYFDWNSIPLYPVINRLLFQFKHFGVIHVAGLEEPRFTAKNYIRFDRRQLDLNEGVTTLKEFVKKITGITITQKEKYPMKRVGTIDTEAPTAQKRKPILPPSDNSPSTSSAGNNNSKTSKKSFLSGKGAIVLLAINILSLFCFATATRPMICPDEAEPIYIRLKQPECRVGSSFNSLKLIPKELTIFKPNIKSVEVPAHYCTIIRQRLELKTDFWGTRLPPNATQTYLPVSYEECKLMVVGGKCMFGELSGPQTIKVLTISWKWHINGSTTRRM